MSSVGASDIHKCKLRPIVHQNGYLAAAMVSDEVIRFFSLLGDAPGHQIALLPVSVSRKPFTGQYSIFRWCPNSPLEKTEADGSDKEGMIGVESHYLALSAESRLVVLSVDLNPSILDPSREPLKMNVVADVEFPTYLGKITSVEFLFGGRFVFLLFEMNTYGSVMSLEDLSRSDLPNIKYASSQSYTGSHDHRYFSVLLREQNQDRIAVFSAENRLEHPVTFATDLVDTHGIRWSPDDQPVLMVWESAAYGPLVKFYIASGHYLRTLDLSWEISLSRSSFDKLIGPGITCIDWAKLGGSSTHTVVAAGDGSGELILRYQVSKAASITGLTRIKHPRKLGTQDCVIWQEHQLNNFQREPALIETPSGSSEDVEIISISGHGELVASKISTFPRTVWVWHARNGTLSAVITFQQEVKQLLWHPSLGSVMIVITKSRTPTIYIWYDGGKPILSIDIPLPDPYSSSSWRGYWLTQQQSAERRQLFLLASSKQFNIGYLGITGNKIRFDSIVGVVQDFSDELTEVIDTPTKRKTNDHKLLTSAGKFTTLDPGVYWLTES